MIFRFSSLHLFLYHHGHGAYGSPAVFEFARTYLEYFCMDFL